MPQRIRIIFDYIDRHLARVQGIEDLTRAFPMPEETLRKAFRRVAGMPIGRYLRMKRVEEAKWLLKETDLSCKL